MLIRGSYGTLTVDRQSGKVLKHQPFRECNQYADIVRFDPKTLPNLPECDIVGVGFWDDKGRYEHPMTFSEKEQMWVDPSSLNQAEA